MYLCIFKEKTAPAHQRHGEYFVRRIHEEGPRKKNWC